MATFLEKFSKFTPSTKALEVIEKIKDFSVRYDKVGRNLEITMQFEKIVPKEKLYTLEREMKESYQMRSVFIFPRYPSEEFDLSYYDSLITELKRNTALANGFFNDTVPVYENGTLTVNFHNGYATLPDLGRCQDIIKRIVEKEFGLDIEVKIVNTEEFNLEEYMSREIPEELKYKYLPPAPKAEEQIFEDKIPMRRRYSMLRKTELLLPGL